MKITIQAIKETDESKRRVLTQQAYIVTQEANFPTNAQDVYEHLFEENGNGIDFLALLNDNNELVGFASFMVCDGGILYVKGIVVSPVVQGRGLSKLLLEEAITYFSPDWIALRTHNPRMYEIVTSLSEKFYPAEDKVVPEGIRDMLRVLPFDFAQTRIDSRMVIRNCYPDVKIQQDSRKESVANLFRELGQRDAQVVLVKL